MSWDFERSLDRAQKRWDSTAEVSVSDVVREQDFDKIALLTPKRLIGAHLYGEAANFNRLLRSGALTAEEAVRRLHIWQRQGSRMIAGFEATKVHFQGPRVHAIAYRPISDPSKVAAKAVLLGSAFRHSLGAFNSIVAPDDGWTAAVGIDHGQVTVTRNGTNGDRELLSLGPAANHAAHLLPQSGTRVGQAIIDLLPDDFESFVSEATDGYSIVMSIAETEELTDRYGWSWSYSSTEDRLSEAAERFPLSAVKVSAAKGKIDKDALGLSNTKRVQGTSVFADIDGFTAYIDSAVDSDPDLIEAVRTFHALRSEGRDTAVTDFSALRIQYQGDRIQALGYLPTTDPEQEAVAAVTLAAALTSVAEEVIPQVVPVEAAKPFAIGVSTGEVLVTQLGEQGNRDLVVIGASVPTAAAIQGRLEGGEIGLDGDTRSLLPEWMQQLFTWSSVKSAYVAVKLTYADLLAAAPGAAEDRAVKSALQRLAEEAGAVASPATARPRVSAPVRDEGRPWSSGR